MIAVVEVVGPDPALAVPLPQPPLMEQIVQAQHLQLLSPTAAPPLARLMVAAAGPVLQLRLWKWLLHAYETATVP